MNERHAIDLLLPLSPTPGGAALLRISDRVTEEEWDRLLQLLAVLKPGLVWIPPTRADQEVTE